MSMVEIIVLFSLLQANGTKNKRQNSWAWDLVRTWMGKRRWGIQLKTLVDKTWTKSLVVYLMPSVLGLPRNLHCTIPAKPRLPFSLEHFSVLFFLGSNLTSDKTTEIGQNFQTESWTSIRDFSPQGWFLKAHFWCLITQKLMEPF